MTNNQDARPFVDLRKDAEEFRMKLDEDINDCLSFLDDKIKTLICDPDSFGTSIRGIHQSIHQNTLAEFSKAKYDIFIEVKSLINAKEREWLDYIAEMKKLFIENVEIFLAGTKLEVKLPPSESVPSRVLGSSFHERDTSSSVSKTYAEEKTQFNRRGRLSTSSIKLAFSPYHEEEEMDMEEPELDRSRSRSSSNTRSRKSSNSGLNTSRSSSGRRSSLKKENDLVHNVTNNTFSTWECQSCWIRNPMQEKKCMACETPSTNVNSVHNVTNNTSSTWECQSCWIRNPVQEKKCMACETSNTNVNSVDANDLPKVRGRRGKLTEMNSTVENVTLEIKRVPTKQQSVKSKKAIAQISSSDENEGQMPETTETEMPLKGRRGRAAQKVKANDLSVVVKSSSSNTEEDESQATETIENDVPLKGRRGRSAPKTKDLSVVAKNSTTSTDENENQTTETIESKVSLKGRRGKSASKAKANDLIDQSATKKITVRGRKAIQPSIDEEMYEPVEESMNNQVRRGRSTASKNISGKLDQPAAKKITVRGRKAVQPSFDEEMYEPDQSAAQKITIRGRKAVQPSIDEDIYEPGPSKSKKVSFSGDQSSSDELETPTPLARPVKSAARRKTLLPNLEHLSGADIIPGNPSRSKAKRKTISSASELETVAPSKRLKVGQKSVSLQEEEDSANDNLLESDGNYSEWMSLKSVDGKIPTRSAVYEMKVWRAKKPAYIGSCENLRQKLTLYNLRQNSGHKQLDKFIERNYNEIQVRYEVTPSFDNAKKEVKNRVDSFKVQHKNPPAYN